MQLRADQLASNLDRQGLSPIFCISGDEPLQMLESTDLIRQYARRNGFDERSVLNVDAGFDWNQLHEVSANLSLFSSRLLIELRLGKHKPGRQGGAALVDYAKTASPDNVLLITAAKIDKQAQKTKWYQALADAGTTIHVWPIESARLPGWIITRTKQYGKQISRDAASFVADKVEGNLLAARQELEKLCLLVDKPEIDVQDVMQAVSDSARFDVFSLIECTFTGNTERTLRMLRGFKSEGIEPLIVFGALMWELRHVCSMAHEISAGTAKEKVFAAFRVWPQRKPAINAILNRLNTAQLHSLLHTANTIDKALKGAIRSNSWELLENFMFRIGGIRLQSIDEASSQGPGFRVQ